MVVQYALYVDKHHRRQNQLGHRLKSLGISLHKVTAADEAKKMARKFSYRLVIIHFDTVGKEIFDLFSFFRFGNPHAIIIATMTKLRLNMEEQLFDRGINDVVIDRQTTPKVLSKRIRSHLNHGKSSILSQTDTVRLKDTIVDFNRREVLCNGTIRQLKGISAELLKYFLDNPFRVISREELRQSPIWADSICSSAQEGGKTFDVNVGKLRKVIEPDPANPQIIISVRGIGWKLAKDIIG